MEPGPGDVFEEFVALSEPPGRQVDQVQFEADAAISKAFWKIVRDADFDKFNRRQAGPRPVIQHPDDVARAGVVGARRDRRHNFADHDPGRSGGPPARLGKVAVEIKQFVQAATVVQIGPRLRMPVAGRYGFREVRSGDDIQRVGPRAHESVDRDRDERPRARVPAFQVADRGQADFPGTAEERGIVDRILV